MCKGVDFDVWNPREARRDRGISICRGAGLYRVESARSHWGTLPDLAAMLGVKVSELIPRPDPEQWKKGSMPARAKPAMCAGATGTRGLAEGIGVPAGNLRRTALTNSLGRSGFIRSS